ARNTGRPERSAVETAVERDDAWTARYASRQLQSGLHGLRSGIREEDGVERIGQRRRQTRRELADRRDEAKPARHVDEAIDLFVDCRIDLGVAVTQARDGNPAREVEVDVALVVEQPVALAAYPRPREIATQDRRQGFDRGGFDDLVHEISCSSPLGGAGAVGGCIII